MPASDYQKTYPVSWEQLHRDSRALAQRLLEFGPFKGIIAVTRGGLVPAAVLARELDIHLLDTACVSSYDWQSQHEGTVLKSIGHDGAGWLVVDDLVDSGKTFKLLREMMPKAHFAAVYAKPAGRPMVDTFITETSQDTWILFPWDSAVQYVRPLASRV